MQLSILLKSRPFFGPQFQLALLDNVSTISVPGLRAIGIVRLDQSPQRFQQQPPIVSDFLPSEAVGQALHGVYEASKSPC